MASSPRPEDRSTRHLDLTGDREVVYCHICHHEWYNDEQPGLQCPSCHNDFCEIVRATAINESTAGSHADWNLLQITPDNDPRDIPPPIPSGRPDMFPDPDEDDIGAAFPQHMLLGAQDRNRQGRAYGSPTDPSSDQEIFTRFQETLGMLMGFGNTMGPPGRSNRETLYGGTVETRTYTSPTGRATFSFTTRSGPEFRPIRHNHVQGEHGRNHDDEFEMYGHPSHRRSTQNVPGVVLIAVRRNADRHPRIFDETMGDVRPPQAGPPGFENNLHNLFSMLFAPALMGSNAVHGDAVYSQEALDRIITQLMEANPQSNAAPPATEQAIEKLQKKKLDREMIGDSSKVDCTICMDDLQIGDEVTVLPCKHWFHGECVVLWLKEHNTCPVCRNPIEKRDGNDANTTASGSGSATQQHGSGAPGMAQNAASFGGLFGGAGAGSGTTGGPTDLPSYDSLSARPSRGPRSQEERAQRLNAIRNLASPSNYDQSQPDSPRYRRDSWSPTSPPRGASSARDRSPARPRPDREDSTGWSSQRSGRSNQNAGGNGGGSANPISWLRNRFGNSGGDSADDRNRRRS